MSQWNIVIVWGDQEYNVEDAVHVVSVSETQGVCDKFSVKECYE